MAGLRLGCLFSDSRNLAFVAKTQSPYSVNILGALAARQAVQDEPYIRNYVEEVLAARDLVYAGLTDMGIPFYRSEGNFVLAQLGEHAAGARDALRAAGILVRDRSHEITGAVRITVGTREQTHRLLSQLERFLRETAQSGQPSSPPAKMSRSLLVFDMDGVLADVSESYLAAIAATVMHFTDQIVAREAIEQYKQAGGWNNDWALAQKITQDVSQRGVPYHEVVSVFQSFYRREQRRVDHTREMDPAKWPPSALEQNHGLAIFTGRPRAEIGPTLVRFAPEVRWIMIVADEEVEILKPAPDGLVAIRAAHPDTFLSYVGDNVDDARCGESHWRSFYWGGRPGHSWPV